LAAPEIKNTQQIVADLKSAVDKYVTEKENYEDDNVKITRVQGFRRSWNVAKLETILPRGIFKNVVTVMADAEKIDQYVREKKIDMKKIAPALEETPNRPYAKWSKKSHDANRGEAEANELADALS
jgi:hypothetical protein